MVDSDPIAGAAKATLEKTKTSAGQVTDALKDTADSVAKAGSQAYDRGSELVEQWPGSAVLLAGLVGFTIGVLFARRSPPSRNSLQQYYDRYNR